MTQALSVLLLLMLLYLRGRTAWSPANLLPLTI